jgi:hypothetical protein
MSMEYIRNYYRVPAKRGARVEYNDGAGYVRQGVIASARNGRLMVRLDGDKHPYPFHPTCDLRYLAADQTAQGNSPQNG